MNTTLAYIHNAHSASIYAVVEAYLAHGARFADLVFKKEVARRRLDLGAARTLLAYAIDAIRLQTGHGVKIDEIA